MCKFCRLSDDQKAFIEIFIKCRGNIKEVEKELGISYPTVRGRLEQVASALGYSANRKSEPQHLTSSTAGILDELEKGEITAAEAMERFKMED